MAKCKVDKGFCFLGKFYPESKKEVDLPDDAAKEGLRIGCIAKKAKAAPQNKDRADAPENK